MFSSIFINISTATIKIYCSKGLRCWFCTSRFCEIYTSDREYQKLKTWSHLLNCIALQNISIAFRQLPLSRFLLVFVRSIRTHSYHYVRFPDSDDWFWANSIDQALEISWGGSVSSSMQFVCIVRILQISNAISRQ